MRITAQAGIVLNEKLMQSNIEAGGLDIRGAHEILGYPEGLLGKGFCPSSLSAPVIWKST